MGPHPQDHYPWWHHYMWPKKLRSKEIANYLVPHIWPRTQRILNSWEITFFPNKKKWLQWLRQKKMRFLRHRKKSKLPLAFFQPWKKIKYSRTQKQLFVRQKYIRYRHLPIKDRIDFFRTYIGQMMLLTEMSSQPDLKNTWFSTWHLYEKSELFETEKCEEFREDYDQERRQLSSWQRQFLFAQLSRRSWWYDNLVQKKQIPQSAQRFLLYRPQTAFQIHWKQQKQEPWKNALLFRRAVYAGFGRRFRKENKFRRLKIKPYLRRKNPRSEKRNQLYKRSSLLLANFRQRRRVQAKKAARIKEIVSKIIGPFYGNLRKKQMRFLMTKSKRLKSKILTSNETLLSHLENRLDVVIYRLNLAPTILWARRLIENGSVFVISAQDVFFWKSMYAPLKKIAFPLKLRDPKRLYATKLWTKQDQHWSRFKFLNHPQKKISYLLQPNDLIQCATGNSLSQFKTLSSLWSKPLPKHVLTKKILPFRWQRRFNKFTTQSFNCWEQATEPLNAAVFLHTPKFNDIHSKDRITESFFRWAFR